MKGLLTVASSEPPELLRELLLVLSGWARLRWIVLSKVVSGVKPQNIRYIPTSFIS